MNLKDPDYSHGQACELLIILYDKIRLKLKRDDVYMHTGYYKEQEMIQLDDSDNYDYHCSDFSVMEIINIFNEEQLDLYKYLHGYCDDFAKALNNAFGYDIHSIWTAENKLVHAFCVHQEAEKTFFIDARGITDDWDEFIEEFRDEYSDDLYDEPECVIDSFFPHPTPLQT